MKVIKLLLLVSFVIVSFNIQAKTIYYVTTTGAGNGSSWANAASNIQTMIDKAASGDEVWVAKGTYYPTTETIARDARSATFLLKDGVSLYGGFLGSESTILQRALTDLNSDGKIDSSELVNSTILSGDIDGVTDIWTKTMNPDGKTLKWTVVGNEGNSYNVVTGGSPQTFFNGFTVIGGNANNANLNKGGGIYSSSNLSSCTVSNCSAGGNGGGIYSYYSSYVTNCKVSNCSSVGDGGGIYSSVNSLANCTVSNCSAGSNGGGIYSTSFSISNCTVSNSSAVINGGGIYSTVSSYSTSYVTNCTVSNCSAGSTGGGIYSSSSSNAYTFLTNCSVSNCWASSGGGIYSYYSNSTSYINNCASSNNRTGVTIGSGISGGTTQSSCISPSISDAYIKPTSFIGVAITDAQNSELINANWRLKEGSQCINAGTSIKVLPTILAGIDMDGNLRVLYGSIDIGAYEYIVPTMQMPVVEKFNDWTDFNKNLTFYHSSNLNTGNDIKWTILNQKADFSWQTNLTSTYSQPIFTYQIDGTKTSKVYLRYDMFFQAYAGTITPLGTEKLNVEFSTDLITWSTIATYSNANGTIANQTYKYDISTLAAGKTFFIRFNANGANSNRIEKWEIDNVIIDADGISAVITPNSDKYKYSIADGVLTISGLSVISNITLYDVAGKVITRKNSDEESLSVKLPNKGVYVLTINSNGVISNKKISW